MGFNLPKLNDKLIDRVVQHITKFPEAYAQNIVVESCDVSKRTPCGAIGCFGGWAVLLSNYKPKERQEAAADGDADDLPEAGRLLGLTDEEGEFLFDTASGDPKRDLKTIKNRIADIRAAREQLKKVEKLVDELAAYGHFVGDYDNEFVIEMKRSDETVGYSIEHQVDRESARRRSERRLRRA